ncbi:DUF4134 family protein [Pedobacter miscanthi]|uniref:Carbamoyl phosphate synthetase n=1 Tax=Pedobacter miscanthi TaxID=2259170 RepID=A0A366LDV8_9SPHI|nr:DUF4134 family protein [Pedobacter miscanthi]RBQ12047.1 carbamoyl phosphate synthetase [Pedobacter miscanthi]
MGRFRFLILLSLAQLAVLVADPLVAFAQPGIAEMGQARSWIREYFFSMRDFSYVVSALVALFGAVVVYHKWQMGKDVGMDIPAWFFSSLFVLLTWTFLLHLFGL